MEKLATILKAHVYALADHIGERNLVLPEALRAAERYIAEQWEAQGYAVNRLAYEVRGIECANLEITRQGNRRADEIILIGAHYDTVFGSPGADDNASGVAALLELSRLFMSAAPQRTVRFVAFVNEEAPFFAGRHMGSLIYAKAAKQRGDRIRFMVSLEMLGCYYDTPNSSAIRFCSNTLIPTAATSSPSCPTGVPGTACCASCEPSAAIRVFRSSISQRRSCPAWRSATIFRSGDRVIPRSW